MNYEGQSAATVPGELEHVKSDPGPPTDHLSGLVLPLVDEVLERVAQQLQKLFVVLETLHHDCVHVVLELQQLLDHGAVLLLVHHDGAAALLHATEVTGM